MKFDLKKFKKTAADKHSTTLQHPAGHKITIAHSSISPKMRGDLASLPMAEGGEVGPSGFPKIQVEAGKFSQDAAKLAGHPKKPEGYAKGGDVEKPMMAEGGDMDEIKKVKYESTQPEVTKPKVDEYGYDSNGNKVAPNVRKEHIEQANKALKNRPYYSEGGQIRKMYAEGTDNASSNDNAPLQNSPQSPVVINIGGQGEMPANMLNAAPGSQAKAQAQQAQGFSEMSPERSAQLNPGELPFGVTPEMIAENKAQAPQNAPGSARAPASALSMQQPPQVAPQGSQDGLIPSQQPAAPQAAATPDPFGTKASSEAFEAGLGTQMGGMAQEAAAQGAVGQQEAAIAQQAANKERQALSVFQKANADAMKMSNDALEAYKAGHINPGHYLENMSTAGKIGTIIGLIGAGFGGPENAQRAVDNLNRQIDRDVHAQMSSLDQKKTVFDGYMKQLGNIRDAADMTRVFNTNIYADQLKAAAAKSQDPLAKARLLQASGQLVQQASDRLGQYSMRKALESGAANGIIPPEHLIRAIVPKEEQAAATKALGEAQEGFKARDNALGAFDQVAKLQTVGSRAGSPIQSKRQIAAITGPIVAQLSKATAGRFTEQDAGMLEPLFPQFGDSEETLAVKRAKMASLIGEKLNFPELKKWNIDPSGQSRYNESGQSRIPTSAPVRR